MTKSPWASGRRFLAVWGSRDGLLLAVVAFLLGRARLPGLPPILGLAFVAAARDRFGERSLWTAAFVLLGTFLRPTADSWTAVVAILIFFPAYGRWGRPGAEKRLGIITAAVAVAAAAPLTLTGFAPERLIMALVGAGLAGVAAVWDRQVFPHLLGSSLERQNRDEPIPVYFFLASLLLGIAGWSVAGLPLLALAGGYLTLGLAERDGAGAGAFSGTALGGLLYLANCLPLGAMALFSLAGLLAGAFRRWGRGLSAAAYLIGGGLLLSSLDSPRLILRLALTLLLATAGHLIKPWTRWWPAEGADPTDDGRLRAFSALFQELAQSFNEVAPATESLSEGRLGYLLGTVGELVCSGCALYPDCWQNDLYRNYRAFLGLVVGLGTEGEAGPEALPPSVRLRCQRQNELRLALNYLREIYRLDRQWGRRVRETRTLVADQLRGLGTILAELAVGPGQPPPERPRQLSYRVGVAREAKDGGRVSGDAYLVRELAPGRLLVALADGMGAGPRAALESEAAVGLVGRLMTAGFDQETVLRTVNAVLFLRSEEDSFSTLDLLVIDLTGGESLLYKVGAAPTLMEKDGQVEVLAGSAPPIGILTEIRPEVRRLALEAGHRLILISDGVLSRQPDGVDYLRGFLQAAGNRNPKALAREILGGLGSAEDDRTVLVVELLANPPARHGPVTAAEPPQRVHWPASASRP